MAKALLIIIWLVLVIYGLFCMFSAFIRWLEPVESQTDLPSYEDGLRLGTNLTARTWQQNGKSNHHPGNSNVGHPSLSPALGESDGSGGHLLLTR